MTSVLLVWTTLVVCGFVACAEFGSYAFVHPVVRRLTVREQLLVEKGLLTTFGRVMPVGMTATPVLLGVLAGASVGPARGLALVAVALTVLALATTIAVNVAINRATGTWDPDAPPSDWERVRRRWDRFQAVRSWLLLAGFLVLCAAVAAASP